MNYVICINEECHGFIGIAASYISAIDFLIKKDWLNDNTVTGEGLFVCEEFGEKWVEAIENLGLEKFNDVFMDTFYLERKKVYSKYSE